MPGAHQAGAPVVAGPPLAEQRADGGEAGSEREVSGDCGAVERWACRGGLG